MLGRFRQDMLHGHTAAVRCLRMLPQANLAFTSGYDSTVRVWELGEGIPLAASRPLGETVRAVAADSTLLAVGATDAVIRIWRAASDCAHLFDVAGSRPSSCMLRRRKAIRARFKSGGSLAAIIDQEVGTFHWQELVECLIRRRMLCLRRSGEKIEGTEEELYGHTGPVSCLGLGSTCLFSGSWDMTARAWSRTSLEVVRSYNHRDWLWALAPRGGRLLSTAGTDAYSWDVETGRLLRVRKGLHQGQAYAVEGSRAGHFVFTGGEDGVVHMFDERLPDRPSRAANDLAATAAKAAVGLWRPHTSAINALAFDDPWLVTASSDGTCAMLNVRQAMHGASSAKSKGPWEPCMARQNEQVQRKLGSFQRSVYAVDIKGDKVISGGEDTYVRVFDFGQALEIERRVQAARGSREQARAATHSSHSTSRRRLRPAPVHARAPCSLP
eukprot:SM000147S01120  [mRNA]  locus=s147:266487:268319:+ [translate_table: standard]